jgi:hypothetical protein
LSNLKSADCFIKTHVYYVFLSNLKSADSFKCVFFTSL